MSLLKKILEEHKKWLEDHSKGIRANLRGADLRNANLSYANLSYADLSYADLSYANLSYANLNCTNLTDAYLEGANITDTIFSDFQIPQNTDLIGWGKKNKVLVKLLIPKEAKRTGTPLGKKCRAEFVKVLEVHNKKKEVIVSRDMGTNNTLYKEGELVHPDSYDSNIREECTHGIHFFLTKKEAEAWWV